MKVDQSLVSFLIALFTISMLSDEENLSVGLHPDRSSKHRGTHRILPSDLVQYVSLDFVAMICTTATCSKFGSRPWFRDCCVPVARQCFSHLLLLVTRAGEIRPGDWLHTQRLSAGIVLLTNWACLDIDLNSADGMRSTTIPLIAFIG